MLTQFEAFLEFIPLSFVKDKAFMIPVWQMLLFVFIITFCILLKKYQLGLLISFVFCFYWGFIVNRDLFIGDAQNQYSLTWAFITYVISGVVLVIVPIISFFHSSG